MDTLFTKIINREIPAKIIYEDDQVLAFHDIAPQAPVHFLVIPKKPIRTLNDLTEDDKTLAGHILFTAQRLAKEQGCEDGFRVVMNCNELGGQTVYHIHMHVLGQRQMNWPPADCPPPTPCAAPSRTIEDEGALIQRSFRSFDWSKLAAEISPGDKHDYPTSLLADRPPAVASRYGDAHAAAFQRPTLSPVAGHRAAGSADE